MQLQEVRRTWVQVRKIPHTREKWIKEQGFFMKTSTPIMKLPNKSIHAVLYTIKDHIKKSITCIKHIFEQKEDEECNKQVATLKKIGHCMYALSKKFTPYILDSKDSQNMA